ncbi:MAG: ABC transporter permease [Flavobacteriia bacterium]|nr:ABC transporter permease [Flavobacteriia bacterium]
MIFTIFKKEFIDTLRDKRTIITMVVIPVLLIPLLMTISIKFTKSKTEEAKNKALRIGVVNLDSSDSFEALLLKIPNEFGQRDFFKFKDTIELKRKVKNEELDFALFVPKDFKSSVDSFYQSKLKIYFHSGNIGMGFKINYFEEFIKKQMIAKRLKKLQIDEKQINPIEIKQLDMATSKEMLAQIAGGILPYLFIIFGFMGCMYPAIDLFTGEKERGTLETLLTTPVLRWQVLIGKMLVVILSGILSATFTLFGLFLSMEVFQLVEDPKIKDLIYQILNVKFILQFYFIFIPLIVFFAGFIISLALRAKTFKEAQSTIAPMNAVIILPAFVGFIPGIELDWSTACIPIVNVVLACKEMIADTLYFPHLILSFGMMIVYATIAVLFSYKKFDNEGNLFL